MLVVRGRSKEIVAPGKENIVNALALRDPLRAVQDALGRNEANPVKG
jgi:hypothetical protein